MNSTYQKTVLTLSLAIGLYGTLPAQQIQVHGIVVSAKHSSPLPGVSITVKHESIGTSTDANGQYSIVTNIGGTLCFAFVGCDTYFARVQKAELNVILKENSVALEEVMVTGYASIKKSW